MSNHKGINVPGAVLSMPYISDVDRDDILFGVRMGYDYIAASFVRCADDVRAVRKIIEDNHGRMKIISKIENMQGIDNLDEILEESDGIMVARGDMGVEIPMEDVPILQKKMIKKALRLGKIVITATQMLESMIKNPRPTRQRQRMWQMQFLTERLPSCLAARALQALIRLRLSKQWKGLQSGRRKISATIPDLEKEASSGKTMRMLQLPFATHAVQLPWIWMQRRLLRLQCRDLQPA